MQNRRLALAVRRGALIARIAAQREALATQGRPLGQALAVLDQVGQGMRWLRAHPAGVLAALAALSLIQPRRSWRWAQRAWMIWQTWRVVRRRWGMLAERFGRPL